MNDPRKPSQETGNSDRTLRSFGVVLGLSWLGMLLHDLVEFGFPSPQNSIPFFFIALVLFIVFWCVPGARKAVVLLSYALVALNLFGAITSVFPVPIWPFEPEQTFRHYAVHTVWLLTQLPLLRFLIKNSQAERQW